MLLKRFIRVRIYSANGSTVAYDNKTDTTWGITASSINLNRVICPSELVFGEPNSSMLELQVFGIEEDLTGRKIVLTVEDLVENNYYLADESNNSIVTENDDRIQAGTWNTSVITPMFTGYIESYKANYELTEIDIVAYDWLYFHKDDNIYSWFSTWYENYLSTHSSDQPYMSNVVSAFFQMLNSTYGLEYTQYIPALYDFQLQFNNVGGIPSPIIDEYLTVSEMFKYIFELQLCFVYIDGAGVVQVVRPSTLISDCVTLSYEDYEHDNSEFEHYTTSFITDYRIFRSNSIVYKRQYSYTGSSTSYFDIVDNLFLYGIQAYSAPLMALVEWFNNKLNLYNSETMTTPPIKYTPCTINMIVSDLSLQMGKYIAVQIQRRNDTEPTIKYMLPMEITYSGSRLVDQEIKCNSEGIGLTSKV